MKENAELIVLNLTKFRDNSFILHALERTSGRCSLFVRGGKQVRPSLFLPLNVIEAGLSGNPKSEMKTAAGFSCLRSLNGIRNNLYKNSMTLFLSEVLFKALKEGDTADGLYDWCLGQILLLDSLKEQFSNFPITFLLGLAARLGFRPTWEKMAPFAGGEGEAMQRFIEASFEEALMLKLNGEVRNRLCEAVLRYMEYYSETPLRINSLAVLREVYR